MSWTKLETFRRKWPVVLDVVLPVAIRVISACIKAYIYITTLVTSKVSKAKEEGRKVKTFDLGMRMSSSLWSFETDPLVTIRKKEERSTLLIIWNWPITKSRDFFFLSGGKPYWRRNPEKKIDFQRIKKKY